MEHFFAELKMYGRFAWGLRGYLSHKMSLTEVEAITRQRMAEREANFLRLVERGIFGYSKSPYRPLLESAGCELGDIRNMVQTRGLETTLHELRDSGVYITFEEYKGRKPLVRHGKVFSIQPRQFDNPFMSRHYHTITGGSTGAGSRVELDLDHLAADATHLGLVYHIHGALNTPMAVWFGSLPDCTGLASILMRSRVGSIPLKWFSPVSDQELKPALKYRLANQGTIIAGRLFGTPIPWPEPIGPDQAAVIARWLSKTVAEHGAGLLVTHVSLAMRVCIAAMDEGLDLSNVTMMGGGEPPSPAKFRVIQSSGARWVPLYFFTETGAVGLGCANPVDENDLHFLRDALALIQCPRQVPGSDITVEAFNFTTLLPTAPKLLLNVESDDYGIIEKRSCGCPFESYGFSEHIRAVRSFRKLTGEGVTLVGSEMLHILEEVLPSRFGGSPLDYQLLEEEDQQGFTRLSLLVSPKIQIDDETQVLETVLEALKRSSVAAHLAGELWKKAETIRIRRHEPILTAGGKFMPLRLAKLPHSETREENE